MESVGAWPASPLQQANLPLTVSEKIITLAGGELRFAEQSRGSGVGLPRPLAGRSICDQAVEAPSFPFGYCLLSMYIASSA